MLGNPYQDIINSTRFRMRSSVAFRFVDYSESTTRGPDWTNDPNYLYLASPKLYPQYAEDEDNILYSASISEKRTLFPSMALRM